MTVNLVREGTALMKMKRVDSEGDKHAGRMKGRIKRFFTEREGRGLRFWEGGERGTKKGTIGIG